MVGTDLNYYTDLMSEVQDPYYNVILKSLLVVNGKGKSRDTYCDCGGSGSRFG